MSIVSFDFFQYPLFPFAQLSTRKAFSLYDVIHSVNTALWKCAVRKEKEKKKRLPTVNPVTPKTPGPLTHVDNTSPGTESQRPTVRTRSATSADKQQTHTHMQTLTSSPAM